MERKPIQNVTQNRRSSQLQDIVKKIQVNQYQDQEKKLTNNKSRRLGLKEQFRKSLTLKEKLDKNQLLFKAYRHLRDAIQYRSVRYDLDELDNQKKIYLFAYKLQNSQVWNQFLLILSWVYILLTFLEPVNKYDKSLSKEKFQALLSIEIFIVVLQTLDFLMEIVQKFSQIKFFDANLIFIFAQKKTLFRIVFFFIVFIDLINYGTSFPTNTFRFGRLIRPLQVIIFSKSIRRDFQGIALSAIHLIVVFIIYIIIVLIWSYLGNTIIDSSYVYFESFLKIVNNLYVVTSFDFWPDIMLDLVKDSRFYLIYFVPYLLMFAFLFQPIPVAVVYENYRKHRQNLYIADRIKRRVALLNCFQSLINVKDNDQFISKFKFIEFFKFVYSQINLDSEAGKIAENLYESIDINYNNRIEIDQFFNIIEISEQNSQFNFEKIKPFYFWTQFREYLINKLKVKEFVENKYYQLFYIILTIISCITVSIQLFISDGDFSNFLDILDYVFIVFFSFECITKIISYGIYEYFNDSWNKLDFLIVSSQIIITILFYSFINFNVLQQISVGRIAKITKIQKILRIFRAFRTAKLISFVLMRFQIINLIGQLFYKILICIPIIFKISIICFIIFYIYAVIGVELFTTIPPIKYKPTQYGLEMCSSQEITQNVITDSTQCNYADFNTLEGAFLVLLQVCIASKWGNIVYDYGYKFNNIFLSVVYFNSFNFISVFMIALVGGIIWEVFLVIDKIINNQQLNEEQELMNQVISKYQQKIIDNIDLEKEQDKFVDIVYNLSNLGQKQDCQVKYKEQSQYLKEELKKILEKYNYKNTYKNKKLNRLFFKQAIQICQSMKLSNKEKSLRILKQEIQIHSSDDKIYFFENLYNQEQKKSFDNFYYQKKEFRTYDLKFMQLHEKVEDDIKQDQDKQINQSKKDEDSILLDESNHLQISKNNLSPTHSLDIQKNVRKPAISFNKSKFSSEKQKLKKSSSTMIPEVSLKSTQKKQANNSQFMNQTPRKRTLSKQKSKQIKTGDMITKIQQSIKKNKRVITITYWELLFYYYKINMQDFETELKENLTNIYFVADNHKNQKNIQNYCNKIKEDLLQKENEKKQMNDLKSSNVLINAAILQSLDIKCIQNMEYKYFNRIYGQNFKQIADSHIQNLWTQQSKLLFHFDNLYKYDYMPIQQFLQLYSALELQISALMMNKYCSFKLIFQNENKCWFTINYQNEQIFLQNIGEGIWNFSEELFEVKNDIYVHKNIFTQSQKIRFLNDKIKQYFNSCQQVSGNYYFQQLNIEECEKSTSVYIPFSNNCQKKIFNCVKQIILNCEKNDMLDEQFVNNITNVQNGICIINLFEINEEKEKKTFSNKEKFNLNQAILEDRIEKEQQGNATLNYSQTIEFIKDLKNSIKNNQENIFKKIMLVLYYKQYNFVKMKSQILDKNQQNILNQNFEQNQKQQEQTINIKKGSPNNNFIKSDLAVSPISKFL